MFPRLLEIGDFTIYTYGFMIVLGGFLGYMFMSFQAKQKYQIEGDKISSLVLWVFLSAFVGGKVLFYLEDPERYLQDPALMLENLGSGFVFFGSLLFAVPVTIWFFRKNKWPLWGMLDLVAFTTLIVHSFGRLGCFFAGCCHGIETDSVLGITFTDPACQAEPLGVALHPTQLYAITMLVSIFAFLWFIRKKKQFDGQLFILYVILYSIGRSIIEVFRGDEARGYIIDGILTHSQFISLLLVIAMVILYFWRARVARKS